LDLLLLPTAVAAYYGFLLSDQVLRVEFPGMLTLALCLALGSLLALGLKGRHPHLAAIIYIVGLAGSALGLIWISFNPLAMALFPIVLLLSMALLGPRAMVWVAASAFAVIVGSAHQHGQLGSGVIAPIAVLALTALVAWLYHWNLTTAFEQAWKSYCEARLATDEARQRRGELARTVKALDDAYSRLERFSAQLAQAREAAEEAKRAKQQFVATVSHELRTPLNIIIGFAELMALSPESYGVRGVPRRFVGDVNRIYRSAKHLKGLIDDVLDLAQLEARQMVLLTERVVLSELVAEAVDLVWSLVARKGLQLVVDVPATLPLVTVDRLRIRQVLLNLLSNAARFTDQGQITVSAQAQNGEVEVAVADTGMGIAPEDIERVFEEFRQLDASPSRRYEGTGLGLSLSRRLVGAHGGRMWAESEPGLGSRFHFTLPLLPPSPEQTQLQFKAMPLPHGVAAQLERTVLVDSPEPMTAGLLQRHLRGYQVRGTSDEGLEGAVKTYLPHAVIKNSLVAKAAGDGKSGAPDLHTSVINCPLPEPGVLGRTLGVDYYLVKPVDRERLLAVLGSYGDSLRRILIVDDDAQLAELVARVVRAAPGGYVVEMACGGEEGWQRMQEWQPDLVLLDLMMQRLDGFAILKLMRADQRLRTVPVIVITALDLPSAEYPLPGKGKISVEGLDLTVSEALNCLQAILDALPPPRPASALPPRPVADRPG